MRLATRAEAPSGAAALPRCRYATTRKSLACMAINSAQEPVVGRAIVQMDQQRLPMRIATPTKIHSHR